MTSMPPGHRRTTTGHTDNGDPATGGSGSHRGRQAALDPQATVDPQVTAGPQITVLLDSISVARTIRRLAHEILERHASASEIILLGIPTRGVPLAQRLADAMAQISGHAPTCAQVSIAGHRDDRDRTAPVGHPIVEPQVDVTSSVVVLVDDVLHTGRTARAALDAVTTWGRPTSIFLAVLVDRGHRQVPIKADFVGKNIPTSASQRIYVHLTQRDGRDEVVVGQSQPTNRAEPAEHNKSP